MLKIRKKRRNERKEGRNCGLISDNALAFDSKGWEKPQKINQDHWFLTEGSEPGVSQMSLKSGAHSKLRDNTAFPVSMFSSTLALRRYQHSIFFPPGKQLPHLHKTTGRHTSREWVKEKRVSSKSFISSRFLQWSQHNDNNHCEQQCFNFSSSLQYQ